MTLKLGKMEKADGEETPKKTKDLLKKFIINQQKADNLGHTEMIDGIVAGIHFFCKQSKLFFKDINQKDECMIGEKKCKIYTRDAMSDENMLVYETYFKKHPEIDIFICCKIKGGKYEYLGYVTKDFISKTRIIQMIGDGGDKASEDIRRIFAEQYLNLSDFFKIEDTEKEIVKEIIKQNYVPLHVHSEYSVGDGFGQIPYLVKSLKEKGFKGAALTDHGTMAGVLAFQRAMLEQDLKPIIGCEIYVKLQDKAERYHLVVLVKNEQGWKNLLKLQSIAVRDHFYYKPVIPVAELFKYHEGLIVTSACMAGIINAIWRVNPSQARRITLDFQGHFGDDFYLEMQPNTIEDNQETLEEIYHFGKECGIKSIITTDSHYPNKEEKEIHEAVKAINFRKKYGEAGFSDDCFYLMQDSDMKEHLTSRRQCHWLKDVLDELNQNTFEILDKCNFKITPSGEADTLPKIFADNNLAKDELKRLCVEGLETRTKYKYEGKIKERLDHELNRMLEKNYENYFLIVQDMIQWAKKNKIRVGPGRGSVGGSFAAYALGITETDTLEFDLMFDRFLSEIRRDAPDVDMDFMDSRRHEVFDYLKEKYGANHCAKIITSSRFHPKGVLKDIGRIFDIPSRETNKICSIIIERSGGDARASFGLTDTFEEFSEAKEYKKKYPQASAIACKLEGHIRHKGIHAAGLIISDRDISEYVPITRLSGEIVTEWEKFQTEDMGLVKFDILGLKTLSVIESAVQLSGCVLPTSFEDENIYKNIFQSGNTAGVFQIETVGLTKLAQSIKLKNFNQLYDVTTLYRPGALHSGQTQVYVNRVLGLDEVKPFHPLLTEITASTQGIICYQEQIMRIMHEVGCMSWATAEMARKVITKSKGKDAFNKMRAEFVNNANRIHKMERSEAEDLYDIVSTFGSYSFNKSHAVEYSIISYQCAWLKNYYPAEFFAALLMNEKDKTSVFRYLQDADKNNVSIEYPDVNFSKENYSIYDKKIYAGFDAIIGVGKKTAEKIIKLQPYTSYEDFIKRCKPSSKIMKGLIISDCFRSFGINKKNCFYGTDSKEKNFNQYKEDFTDKELAKLIYNHTTMRPKMDIKSTFDFGDYDFVDIIDCIKYPKKQILIRGIVTEVLNKDKLLRPTLKDHKHSFEQHMIFLNLNDGTGDIAVQVNPWTYELYQSKISDLSAQPIIAMGQISVDGRKMYCDLLELADDKNHIKKFFKDKETNILIASAQPALSKKGNSYYRILISDGATGLCFKPPEKLFPGMKVRYRITKDPFIDLQIKK